MKRLLLIGLWTLSLGLFSLGTMETYGLLHATQRAAPPFAVPPLSVISRRTLTAAAYDSALSNIIQGNVFRRDRSPAAEVAQPSALAPRPPRPHIELRGVMGGPPWQVLIDGVPGHQSSVLMRVGESVGGITVMGVKAGTVVLKGADTVWHLTLRN